MIGLAQLKRNRLYSEELGINLATGETISIFAGFSRTCCSVAISAKPSRAEPITLLLGLTRPSRILVAGREFPVNPVMREGGHVRYDFSKSRQILRDCQNLVDTYEGSPWWVHEMARDAPDLEARLLAFYGVGPVTANIFLRELRPFWPKGKPVAAARGDGGCAKPRPRSVAIAAQDPDVCPHRSRSDPNAAPTWSPESAAIA